MEKAKEQATAVSFDTNKNIKPNQGGTSSTYRLSKLKRDAPEVAKRVEAGEFKTVADAERAAGIKPPKRDTRSPEYLLTYCRERLGADSRVAAIKELTNALSKKEFRELQDWLCQSKAA